MFKNCCWVSSCIWVTSILTFDFDLILESLFYFLGSNGLLLVLWSPHIDLQLLFSEYGSIWTLSCSFEFLLVVVVVVGGLLKYPPILHVLGNFGSLQSCQLFYPKTQCCLEATCHPLKIRIPFALMIKVTCYVFHDIPVKQGNNSITASLKKLEHSLEPFILCPSA